VPLVKATCTLLTMRCRTQTPKMECTVSNVHVCPAILISSGSGSSSRARPEARAGKARALDARLQFQVGDVGIARAEAGKRAEAAVGPGDHALAPHDVGKADDALGDQ